MTLGRESDYGSSACAWPGRRRQPKWSRSIYERPDTRINGRVLTDIEYEIEPAGEAVACVRYPHQQFALE
jgi:hypothetical protein